MSRKPSWIEEAWERFLRNRWDKRKKGINSIQYTKEDLEPFLAQYTKSGQGEIRIFHYGASKCQALKKRGLAKIPLTRNSWKLVKRSSPIEFREPINDGMFQPRNPLTEGMRAGITETMNTKTNPGETTLLAIANHAGIISDFYGLNEQGILFTGGRQKAGVHLVLDTAKIDMRKAQIEIDGGFEWPETVVIVEMKSSFKQSDFDVNQALIPMLKWQKLLSRKKVYSLVLLAQTNTKGIEYWAYDLIYNASLSRIEMKIGKNKKYIIELNS